MIISQTSMAPHPPTDDDLVFSSWKAQRYKPKFHDGRHCHKIDLQKGNNEKLDTFEKIRRHK